MRRWRLFGALLALAVGSTSATLHDAEACGGFFTPRPNPMRRPSLAYEQALIVHDAQKGREHFIREIVFRASDETFGFVVPTPSIPEVAKVADSPFPKLRETFPYEAPTEGIGLGGLGTLGHGQGFGAGAARSVTVLDVQRVGSFTAYVLAADDAGALQKWLADNGLVTSPEAEPWLAHYVAAKFFYVAMRYDPPPQAKPKPGAAAKAQAPATTANRAEVVRISFDTPRPFYPYYEPEKPAGGAEDPRLLEVWLATTGAPKAPVGARVRDGQATWARPFAEGQRYPNAREALAGAMGREAAFLPSGPLQLQRFMDQKRRRTGWGDVVFVPTGRDPLDAVSDAALSRMADVLTPSITPAVTK